MKKKLVLLAMLGLLAACSTGSGPQADFEVGDVTWDASATYVPGEVIVKFKDQVSLSSLSQSLGVQVQTVRELSGGELLLAADLGAQSVSGVPALVEALSARPDVLYAQPNYLYYPMAVPNDPNYRFQWHYPKIGLPAAWDLTTGTSSVVVAVLDTGSTAHPDLNGTFVGGYDFISSRTNARDNNGRDSNPTDPGDAQRSYHGTHVAGTVAARSNNGVGVAGVCWNCKVLPVRVLGYSGGSTADIIDGMRWSAGMSVSGVPANANPAKVLNLSLGGSLGSGTCSVNDVATQNAVNDVVARGVTVVVAAGNSNADARNFTPASCNNVITVAATETRNYRAPYSNFGSTVEIAAPGGDTSIDRNADGYVDGVLSTLLNSRGQYVYSFYQGTSMATPHVAGLVGLMLSRNPSLTPAQVLSKLQSTATPFVSGACTQGCGAGVINAAAAVQ